jgi:hypothetical protein
MRTADLIIVSALASFSSGLAIAQGLPAPSRTVYKCEVGGKVVYSDSPCLGAQRVDVTPTQGLNKSSGSERVGADVRRERHNETMAEVMRPLFAETAEQRAKRHRRASLAPDVRRQCDDLDRRISSAELEEGRTAQAERQTVQERLLGMRAQHRDLKC